MTDFREVWMALSWGFMVSDPGQEITHRVIDQPKMITSSFDDILQSMLQQDRPWKLANSVLA